MLQNLEKLDLLIARYVSGSLPAPAHVLIRSYLEMQPPAARFANVLDGLAGEALFADEPVEVSQRERRLDEILHSRPPADAATPPPPPSPSPSAGAMRLPASLRAYASGDLSEICWTSKFPGLRQHVIEKTGEVETSFVLAKPGQAIPSHGHQGLELTLVLQGGFSDYRGMFGEGDVSVADKTVEHQPVATRWEPCLCFSVVFAPVALSSPTLRLFGDMLGL